MHNTSISLYFGLINLTWKNPNYLSCFQQLTPDDRKKTDKNFLFHVINKNKAPQCQGNVLIFSNIAQKASSDAACTSSKRKPVAASSLKSNGLIEVLFWFAFSKKMKDQPLLRILKTPPRVETDGKRKRLKDALWRAIIF